MTYLDPTQDQEEEKRSQSQAQNQVVTGGAAPEGAPATQNGSAPEAGSPESLPGSGGGVLSPGSPGSPETGQSSGKPTSPGGWTNLQSYLDANTDQASQMGSQIAGNLDSEGKGAKSAIDQAQGDFTSGLNSSGTDLSTEKPFIDQAVADPTATQTDSGASSRFKQDFSGTYSGPKQLSDVGADYSAAQGKVTQANQDLGLAGTESGRGVLLQNQYGAGGNYNEGEKGLDQLLLEGNPKAQAALGSVTKSWAGLSDALSQNANADQAAAAARAAGTQAVNQYAGQAVGTAQSGIQGQVNANVTADQAALTRLQTDIANHTLTPDELSEFGLTSPMTYSNDPYGLLNHYVASPAAISAATVATPEEQAQYAALAALGGKVNDFLPDAAQVGTYHGPVTDTKDLNAEISGNKAGYTAAAQPFVNDIQAAIGAGAFQNGSGQQLVGNPDIYDPKSILAAEQFAQNQAGNGPAAASFYQPIADQMAGLLALLNQYGGTAQGALTAAPPRRPGAGLPQVRPG